MRKLLTSTLSFSWAMTLLGTRGLTRLLGLRTPATQQELAALNKASKEHLSGPFEGVHQMAEDIQDRLVDGLFDSLGEPEGSRRPASTFDPSTFVVLGDGLAAGMGHFALEGSFQATSFPALVARALGTPLRQPLFQPPGLGDVIGLEPRPPIVPEIRQSTVLHELPPAADLGNLAVPGFTLADALERRPIAPLVDRSSSLQTLTNFILGLPELEIRPDGGRTQVEYALGLHPTLALVCFGYDETLRAAVDGDLRILPTRLTFERQLSRLLRTLEQETSVIVTTVPDPFDSAYFSPPRTAAEILKTTPDFLEQQWEVQPTDQIHLTGLWAMGYQTMAREVASLAGSAVIDQAFSDTVRARVTELNAAIRSVAERNGARVFDLGEVLRNVAQHGLEIAGRCLRADYLGGLYLLNGVYPGPTLNAHIASAFVEWLNRTFELAHRPASVDEIATTDANTLTELAPGPPSTDAFLRPRTPEEIPQIPTPQGPVQPPPIQTTYPSLQPGKENCVPAKGIPAAGLADPSSVDPDFQPIDIPAEGLDYTLEINPELSCFGDALRPVDCPGEPPTLPGFPPFGLCERTFFGGFLPTTSSLSGNVQIKITAPDANGFARFEIRHPDGLRGAAGDLTGPQLFRMPVQHTAVRDLPGLVSSGKLEVRTGRVFDFHYNLQNMNTALYTLLELNPWLPAPIRSTLLTFPGQPNGGSTWAEFTPRPDGLLDVSLAAHMFVPFGTGTEDAPLRFALPFTSPDLAAASFVARGTSIHPRIFVTTRATPGTNQTAAGDLDAGASTRISATIQPVAPASDVPFNSVVELSAFSNETYFGDAFDLHAPELGDGGAVGRSHLLGRVRVQFGARTGDTVPAVFQILPPGGLLSDAPAPPQFLPPGVSRGGAGFNTVLHFPKQAYPQSGLASPDDPFNVCSATLHLGTGQTVGPLLWRGYVVQALFSELIQVEPCTPADSFNYQGPASFDRRADGGFVLRWNGAVYLPYPKGFAFPSSAPGGRPPIVTKGESRLDPFRSIRAGVSRHPGKRGVMQGDVAEARSPATGEEFSYRWSIPYDPRRANQARFEYVNHTHGNAFRLTSLSWLDFSRTLDSPAEQSSHDVVTFSGFGAWSEDPETLHQVSVQISTAPDAPFVGIQVDGGAISNVDIKPERRPVA